jgi:ABC-type sugar transport system permease subunit
VFTLQRRRRLTAWAMCAPAVMLATGFIFYPLARGAWISLHQWDGFSAAMKWFGLRNYANVAADGIFWRALGNTLIFAIAVTVAKNVLGMFLATLLNRRLVGRGLFRTATFLPVVMSFVVVGILWSWIFNPTFGLLDSGLRMLGLDAWVQGWLSDPRIALGSVIAVDVWKWTGFHVVVLLAGLQTIPAELLEAAAIDGASKPQIFRKITLPQMMPVLSFSVLMSLTGAFVSNYDLVYVMTGGGPRHATEVALTWIMNAAFQNHAVGKANAMSIILFVCVAAAGALQLRVMMARSGGR